METNQTNQDEKYLVSPENLDEKYQIKSEIEHVLDRPGMWVGSMITEVIDYPLFVPSKNRMMVVPNTGYNGGLLKLIDEVLSNSVDEHRRKDSLFKINNIKVTINSDGYVCIEDDGGIPVIKHKVSGLMVSELIFGQLRTGSNYDDTQDRSGVGTNGLGAKLTNIFSKKFIVHTADNKNEVTVEWYDNMKESNKDLEKYPSGFEIKPTTKHGTKIEFWLDLERFEMEELPLSIIRLVQRRCIDAAAVNPELVIEFVSNVIEGRLDSKWQFPSFADYVRLYLDAEQAKQIISHDIKRDNIIIIPENLGFNLGFVNGALCSQGTHIKKIEKQISDKMVEICTKNDMELITQKDVLNRLSLFVNTTVSNPSYDSQSKDKLSTQINKFALNFGDKFLNNLKNTEIFQSLKDYYEIKYAEQKKKETRKLNATIKTTKIKKLIAPASKTNPNNELWLFEGNSASNGFRKHRNLNQGAYLLRGKIKNTFNLDKTQILENQELREVIAILNILFNSSKQNLKNCNYSKVVISTDMDYDGHHICGLLIAFFAKHFPELFKAGLIYRALSPIVIASKGKDRQYFYSLDELHKVPEAKLKGYEFIYTKGLGGLSDVDYRQMLRNQKLQQFTLKDVEDMEAINIWFDKSTDQRKELLANDSFDD